MDTWRERWRVETKPGKARPSTTEPARSQQRRTQAILYELHAAVFARPANPTLSGSTLQIVPTEETCRFNPVALRAILRAIVGAIRVSAHFAINCGVISYFMALATS